MSVSVNRRRFMGTAGSALGLGMAGCGSMPDSMSGPLAAPAVVSLPLDRHITSLITQSLPAVGSHRTAADFGG